MFKEKIIIEMKEVFKEIPFGIEHTLKVLKNAEDIMKGENIGEEEKEFISIIAILHDIGAVAFFDLLSGIKLAIWERKNIAHDAQINQTVPSPTEFTIGHNVESKEEVDKVIEQARTAGAIITVQPHDTFWGGYSGYFQDPDGHLWEVVWNPHLEIKE